MHAHKHTHTSPSDRRPDVHPPIGLNQTLTHAQIHQEKRLFQQNRCPVRNNRRFPPKSRSCVKLFPCKSETGWTGFDSDMHGTELSPKWLRRAKRIQQANQFPKSNTAKPRLMNINYATWRWLRMRALIGRAPVNMGKRPGSWILNHLRDWTLPEACRRTSARPN